MGTRGGGWGALWGLTPGLVSQKAAREEAGVLSEGSAWGRVSQKPRGRRLGGSLRAQPRGWSLRSPRGGGWGRVSQKPPGKEAGGLSRGSARGGSLRSPREGGSAQGASLRSPRAAVRTRALSGCLLVYASSAGSCTVRKDRPSGDLRLRTRPISSHFLRSVWNKGQRMTRPVSCHLPLREGPQSAVGAGLAQRGLLPQRLRSLASCFLTVQTTSVSSKGSIPCLFVSNVLNVC